MVSKARAAEKAFVHQMLDLPKVTSVKERSSISSEATAPSATSQSTSLGVSAIRDTLSRRRLFRDSSKSIYI